MILATMNLLSANIFNLDQAKNLLFGKGLKIQRTVLLPCVKSNAPGPSVVPAAKLYPMAGLQVFLSCSVYIIKRLYFLSINYTPIKLQYEKVIY